MLRIGEFSRRVGVSADLLRAWERRYQLLEPVRTPTGLRLYTQTDATVVAAMRAALAEGVPAAEAARVARAVREEAAGGEGFLLEGVRARLRAALDDFEDGRAQAELDRLFGSFGIDTALSQVVLPYLRDLGERWACGEATVGQEHFASQLIAGRLQSLARDWDVGGGPRALVACPPGELHTIGVMAFGLALRTRGWRITYLGADTPVGSLAHAADALRPAFVVLGGTQPSSFARAAEELRALAEDHRVGIGGRGATEAMAERLGARLLGSDAVAEAGRLHEAFAVEAGAR